MLLQTILKRTLKYKGFVFGGIIFGKLRKGMPTIEIRIVADRRSKPVCSICGRKRSGYDTLPERKFEHIPFWGFLVFFVYGLRRVDCPDCGVTVERVPWADGKNHLTGEYVWFLSGWAKRLSWKEVAGAFKTTWYNVFVAVEAAVAWGRLHMDLSHVASLGIDEIKWHRGRKFLTMVYQIDGYCKRLLWVGEDRLTKTLRAFFKWFGKERSAALKFICSDMWKPYLKIIARKAGQAIHILDRFHIIAKMNEAIDDVRAAEVKHLAANGHSPVLKHSRWIWLKRPENLTNKETLKLADLLHFNLKTIRSYLLKLDFQDFWEQASHYWAGKFLDSWCRKVMRSQIKPMKKIAKIIRSHQDLILNWFKAEGTISAATVEGLNNKAKLTFRKAYGFRTFRATEIALYHTLGNLPEPVFTHKFF